MCWMTVRPLAGVTVLEMGTFITGPAAGMLLADLGADVIKVEQPVTGDPFRSFKGELYAPHFQTYNRNKRSITIDPKQARPCSHIMIKQPWIDDASIEQHAACG